MGAKTFKKKGFKLTMYGVKIRVPDKQIIVTMQGFKLIEYGVKKFQELINKLQAGFKLIKYGVKIHTGNWESE